MALSTTKGFPYPEDADDTDVPGDMQALADAIDAMPGISALSQAQIDALGAAGKWAGRIVWNTTTQALQRCDGSAWVELVIADYDGIVVLAANSSSAALQVTQSGSGNALLVEDEASDATPFVVAADGKVAIGDTTTSTRLLVRERTATTNAAVAVTTITASSTGTPAAGFGPGLELHADDTAGTELAQAAIRSAWTDPTASTVDSAIGLFTRKDGGALTEQLRVDADGLLTGAGKSLGAWTDYTPTLSGWSLGNGSTAGKYVRIGRTVIGWAKVVYGSTTNFNAVQPYLTLPVTAASGAVGIPVHGYVQDVGGSSYLAFGYVYDTAKLVLYNAAPSTSPARIASGAMESSAPITTWASGDYVYAAFMYEAAS